MVHNVFKSKLREAINLKSELVLDDNKFNFGFELDVQAGLWIEDSFAKDGISGGALVKVDNDEIHVFADVNWNTLEVDGFRLGAIVVPIQESEKHEEGSEAVQLEGVDVLASIVELEFLRFSISEDLVRYAIFGILKVSHDDSGILDYSKSVLSFRNKIMKELPANKKNHSA